jgi:quercetin dioxygenase-like cupin family protein
VHEGQVHITLGDDSVHELGPGGLARVDAATVRRIKNVGDGPAVLLVVGGKDGYVGRDGKLPEGDTSRFGPGGPPAA